MDLLNYRTNIVLIDYLFLVLNARLGVDQKQKSIVNFTNLILSLLLVLRPLFCPSFSLIRLFSGILDEEQFFFFYLLEENIPKQRY